MGPEPASGKTVKEQMTTTEQDAHDTVEAAIRSQLAKAFGGIRGVIEAAVPTAVFTVMWIATSRLQLSLIVSASTAVVLLVARLVQRSTPQYVINSLIGIGIGWFFASRTGEAKDVYLPGILYNAGYSVAMLISIVTRWPVVGFLIGSVTGDPTAWRSDPAVVKLCSRLTWLLMIPCVVRVAVQAPVYLIGGNDAVAELGILKIVMGWPLQIAALGAMVWLLARGRTPVRPAAS
ncbi:membrane protein [Planomonospora sphaerica]|uniref:Membrane protein n=3 Tax=Planomonospora TaxID=1998 RepID=A0A171C578_9ACTN|nr:membrane protein [Planomonospora sphaerica]